MIYIKCHHSLALPRGLVRGTGGTEKGDFLENRETTILQKFRRLSAEEKFAKHGAFCLSVVSPTGKKRESSVASVALW